MTTGSNSHRRDPPVIEAPCPEDRERVLRFGFSADITGHGRANWRQTPLFMAWAHLVGRVPPINNASYATRGGLEPTYSTLKAAKACFRGLKRPHNNEDDGSSVLVYVLKPAATLQYDSSSAMVCPMSVLLMPSAAVLTVQVRLAASLQEPVNGIDGIVTRIEPVAGEKPEHALPVGHADRYAHRCW
ncbi:hypothetical protein MKK65_29475 [Methylobacterium sp. J-001]|uniref:hypothetical protein n=1 Tax=Methylobacterium sp. J-001 TaxID=2836609 RepID=UPI001FBB0D0C|nr:hypothetical protein [Methylobacterium sp. J-001]MCJ2120640.1 hypothetical protein [Methylobacterium sp. J-001]